MSDITAFAQMNPKHYPLHHGHDNVTISRELFNSMKDELERLRPMETGLELAEADRDAYKRQAQQLKEKLWISVDVVRPEWGKIVKIKFKNGSEDERRFSHDYKWVSKGMATCEAENVTHWMPKEQ